MCTGRDALMLTRFESSEPSIFHLSSIHSSTSWLSHLHFLSLSLFSPSHTLWLSRIILISTPCHNASCPYTLYPQLYQEVLALPDVDNCRFYTSPCPCGSNVKRSRCCTEGFVAPYVGDTELIDPRAIIWK